MKPERIVDFYAERGYKIVVITDHNEIEGALLARNYAHREYEDKIEIIIGEEVQTDAGDIIGFPLTVRVAPGRIEDVIENIKAQGAYVCLPHPYTEHKTAKIESKEILSKVDFIEVFNSRASGKMLNEKAEDLCAVNEKKRIIGADAHLMRELDNTFFIWSGDFAIIECLTGKSTKRNVRLSSMIKAYKSRRYLRIAVHFILYILGK